MHSPFQAHFNFSVIARFHRLFDQCATLRLFKARQSFFPDSFLQKVAENAGVCPPEGTPY